SFSVVFLTKEDQLTLAAAEGIDAAGIEAIHTAYPRPVARDTTSGRAILDRRLVHLADSWLDPEYTHPLRDTIALRSILTLPIFRDGAPIGAVSVWRGEPRPFTDTQIALLQTFADQAVIAIENVRLFKELQARNGDLTELLEQQTATSEILRVISSSPTDVQPVFDIIGQRAEMLCDADVRVISKVDGDLIELVSLHGLAAEGVEAVRGAFPMRRSNETVTARTVRTCAVVHVPDVLADAEYEQKAAAQA